MTMNSLEGRVRAALRATADEITPHDVPPLAQPTMSQNDSANPAAPTGNSRPGERWGLSPHHWGSRQMGSRHSGLRHWGVPLAASVAVLAVIAATVGTVRIVGSSAGPRTGGQPGTTSAPLYGSVATLTQDLIDQFVTATGPQLTAGSVFQSTVEAHAGTVILDHCLAAHGIIIAPPAARAGVDGEMSSTLFLDLNAMAKSGIPDTVFFTQWQGQGYPDPLATSEAFTTALSECQSSGGPFDLMYAYGQRLRALFRSQVLAIQSSAPVRATIPGLRACASKYGWPRDYAGKNVPLNSISDFWNWMQTFLAGPEGRDVSMATAQALDRHWAPIFIECVRPTVAVMARLALAAQRSFLASHRTQLAHLVSLAIAGFNQANKDAPSADRRSGVTSRGPVASVSDP
jgi:hypothetical protein